MREITGINHIGVRIRDLTTSRSFYAQLGFDFVAGPLGPEPVAIMRHPSGVVINFIINADGDDDGNVLMDRERKYPGYTHIAFDVADIRSTQAAIERQRIMITEGPLTLPDGAVMFFVRDPDGNVIEFHQDAS